MFQLIQAIAFPHSCQSPPSDLPGTPRSDPRHVPHFSLQGIPLSIKGRRLVSPLARRCRVEKDWATVGKREFHCQRPCWVPFRPLFFVGIARASVCQCHLEQVAKGPGSTRPMFARLDQNIMLSAVLNTTIHSGCCRNARHAKESVVWGWSLG